MLKNTADLELWIKQELGYPTINIEIESSTIQQCIYDSVQYYAKYSSEITYRTALVLQLSGGVSTYPIDHNIISVLSMDQSQGFTDGINVLFSPQNQLYQAGAFNFLNGGGMSALVTFEIGMQYLEMIKDLITVKYNVQFNKYDHTLTITPAPTADSNYGTDSLIGIMEVYTSNMPISGADSEVYDEWWVKNYALARVKKILGKIWGKYGNIALPGGGVLNAKEMSDEGKAEMKELEDNLIKLEGEPLEITIA